MTTVTRAADRGRGRRRDRTGRRTVLRLLGGAHAGAGADPRSLPPSRAMQSHQHGDRPAAVPVVFLGAAVACRGAGPAGPGARGTCVRRGLLPGRGDRGDGGGERAAEQRAGPGPARTAPTGAELWPRYLTRWTAWNHVRTVASTIATLGPRARRLTVRMGVGQRRPEPGGGGSGAVGGAAVRGAVERGGGGAGRALRGACPGRPGWRSLAAAGIGAGTRVLDVGCGSGEFGAAGRRPGSRHGRHRRGGRDGRAGRPPGRRRPTCGSAPWSGCPGRTAVFDVVTGFNAFQFAPDLPAALAEAGRVTRPGGRVAVCNWGPVSRTASWSRCVRGPEHLRRSRRWCRGDRSANRGNWRSWSARPGCGRAAARWSRCPTGRRTATTWSGTAPGRERAAGARPRRAAGGARRADRGGRPVPPPRRLLPVPQHVPLRDQRRDGRPRAVGSTAVAGSPRLGGGRPRRARARARWRGRCCGC